MRLDTAAILERAIDTYGATTQQDKLIEEMSELMKAILKLRYCTKPYELRILQDAVNEEMADVEIMLLQMKMIFNNWHEVDQQRIEKLERLRRRLDVCEK